MTLPQPFTTVNPILASYSFTNLIEGSGGVNFYAGNAYENVASMVNILSSMIFSSSTSDSMYYANGADYTLLSTDTYSLTTAVKTNVLKGYALITLGWGMKPNSNNQGQSSGYITAEIHKNTTSLGSATTSTKTSTGTAGTFSAGSNQTLKIDIAETVLSIGDTLKVVFKVYGKKASGSSGGYVVYGHDPENGDGNSIIPSTMTTNTQIKCIIPFKTE